MTIVNARARFGLEDGRIFDYATSKSFEAVGYLDTSDGRWDLAQLADCLRHGWFIEAALSKLPVKTLEEVLGEDDKVAQANRDFLAGPLDPPTDTANSDEAPETPAELAQPEEQAVDPPKTV